MPSIRIMPIVSLAASLIASAAGCASPPSVVPLLTVVDKALAAEGNALETDAERREAWFEQSRRALADAFEADLAAQSELERQWVRDHAGVYAAAREALARREIVQQQALQTRRENLAVARDAQRRAIQLIQRQDRLFDDVPDVRRWTNAQLSEENQHEQ